MIIFITGCCGFIGGHLTEMCLKENYIVIGIDNMNDFIYESYNVQKKETLKILKQYNNFTFIENEIILENDIFETYKPDFIVHLAAHANVRKSILHKNKYIENNVYVTNHLLELISKLDKKPIFIYASSSSVYGKNTKIPFEETDKLNNIQSMYALSKKMKENLVDFYCNTENIKAIGLRFFTVYGPRGRPDMAVFQFLNKINNEEPITMYGDGSMERDFTYIHDIIQGIMNCFQLNMKNEKHIIFNLGNNKPVKLINFINLCGKVVGKKPNIIIKEIPKGDVPITYANIDKAKTMINYNPNYDFLNGLQNTFEWIKSSNLNNT